MLGTAALTGCKALEVIPGLGLKAAILSGRVEAASGVNPSVNQRPSPLLVRLYELKAPTAFNQADFMALYSADQASLGGDLLARDELTLQPGESRPYTRTLNPETRHIGVFAAYRDLERARWRAIAPVQPAKRQTLLVRADTLAVSVLVQA
jgi:type VI secretion system protein VasD